MNQLNNCPVCGSAHEINALFCSQCGWEFRVFPDTIPESVLSNEEKRIEKYRIEYERTRKHREKIAELNTTISSLKEEIESLIKKHNDSEATLQNGLKQTESELMDTRSECEIAEKKVSELAKKLSAQLLKLEQLTVDNLSLKKNMSDLIEKYKGYVSPEEMDSFKKAIKKRIDKLYEEIAYQKDEIDRLRKG